MLALLVMNKGYPEDWDWLEDPIPPDMTGAKVLKHVHPTIEVRHIGGEVKTIDVEQATDDGCLHVRWSGNAGVYVIHVFREVDDRGFAHLFPTSRAKRPLQWQAKDPQAARELWRRMTGRDGVKKWEAQFVNGKRKWVPK